jgi:hypothetical protein
MKSKMYEHKMDTRDELLQRIFDAARHVNDVVLSEFTLIIVEKVRRSIQTHSGHFEHLLN